MLEPQQSPFGSASNASLPPTPALTPDAPSPTTASLAEQVHIRRPANSFLLYRKFMAKQIPKKTGLPQRVISKIIAWSWHMLSKEEQQVYYKQADVVAEEHKRQYPDYKFEPRRNGTKQKKTKGLVKSFTVTSSRSRTSRKTPYKNDPATAKKRPARRARKQKVDMPREASNEVSSHTTSPAPPFLPSSAIADGSDQHVPHMVQGSSSAASFSQEATYQPAHSQPFPYQHLPYQFAHYQSAHHQRAPFMQNMPPFDYGLNPLPALEAHRFDSPGGSSVQWPEPHNVMEQKPTFFAAPQAMPAIEAAWFPTQNSLPRLDAASINMPALQYQGWPMQPAPMATYGEVYPMSTGQPSSSAAYFPYYQPEYFNAGLQGYHGM